MGPSLIRGLSDDKRRRQLSPGPGHLWRAGLFSTGGGIRRSPRLGPVALFSSLLAHGYLKRFLNIYKCCHVCFLESHLEEWKSDVRPLGKYSVKL
jgi:hypothetical protein